jgi:hypothetical protein
MLQLLPLQHQHLLSQLARTAMRLRQLLPQAVDGELVARLAGAARAALL